MIDADFLNLLRCPVTGNVLKVHGNSLASADGRFEYPVVDGIPCLIPQIQPTHTGYSALMADNVREQNVTRIDTDRTTRAYLKEMLVPTCGNLYHNASLENYPIPEFPIGMSGFSKVLDIGCNWGRWSIAAARQGHRVVGMDIHLESLRVAQNIANELDVIPRPRFVLGDARSLPFDDAVFDATFSYSVIQHFSKSNTRFILREIRKVLRPGGVSLIQMPNARALRSLIVLAKRGFSEGSEFDVRYYSIAELIKLFSDEIGESTWAVDCFLGLNVHREDFSAVSLSSKSIIIAAEFLRKMANNITPLRRFADSIYVRSEKSAS